MNTILIIDDLKGDLLLVKSIIEKNIKDATVLIANDGRMGLQLAKAHLPDAIILDIYMPKMDGFEVSRKLKENTETRNIPIIMFTENVESSGIMAKGLDSGADVFIYKPIRRIELIAQLNAVLRIKQAEDLIVKENNKLHLKTEELDASKTRYKNLLNNLQVALVIHSEGKVVYANPKAVQLAGADSYKEMLGRSITEFIHSDHLTQAIDNLEKFLKYNTEVFKSEAVFKKMDGTPIEANFIATKTYYQNKLAIQIIIEDISQEKRAAQKLKESEERFGITFELNPDPIIITAIPSGKYVAVNRAFEVETGYSKNEIVGKTTQEIGLWVDRMERDRLFDKLKKSKKGEIQGFETQFTTKKGEVICSLLSGKIIKIEGESYLLSIVKNIQTLKNKEHELFLAKEKAMESDRLKSSFLANMSHEIRTPMNAIIGFTQLMNEDDFSKKEKEGFLDIISKSGQSLLDLINDIIDISTIEAGQVQLNLEPVNINGVNQEVRDIFSLQAKNKGIHLALQNGLSDQEAYLVTDALKLKQVLINLVGNAMKFTSKGHIQFGYEIRENSIEYFVEDTGIGIEVENQPYVFDRFRKGENKTNRAQRGTGLGLSISKAYIEHMGGKIFLKSKPGKGTTFTFSLPYNQPKQIAKNKKNKNDGTARNFQ